MTKLCRFIVLCCLAATLPVHAADIRQGLVSYWPLDSVNDNTTPDLSFGNHLFLRNMGATNLVAGQRGMALLFNGTSQYLGMAHTNDVTLTNNVGLPIYSSKRYTVMAWVKGASNQVNRIVFAEATTNNGNAFMLIGTRAANALQPHGGVNVSIRTAGNTTLLPNTLSSNIAFDNTWHHIAWVDDGGVGRLYIDGVLDAARYTYNQAPIAMNAISVGALLRNNVGNYFVGTIDEVALWERPLSQAEVQEVIANGIATPVPPFAPIIEITPTNPTNRLGDRVVLTSRVFGNRPFAYQWEKDGVLLDNATNSTLTLSNVVQATGGLYTLRVVNGTGSGSNGVNLTVLGDEPPAIANGVVSYWPFDAVTNGTTLDLYSRNDMVLNSMNESSLTTGQFSNSFSFDGFTQYMTRSNGFPAYNLTNYTIAFWVKGLALANAMVFSESSTNSVNPLFKLSTDATGISESMSVFLRTDGGVSVVNERKTTRPVFDNTWHHVVWVDENGAGKLYVDGVLDETDFNYVRGALTLNTTAVGALVRSTVANYFAGQLDELAIWNRRLSLTELQQVMAQSIPAPVAPTPVAIIREPVGTNLFAGAAYSLSIQASGTGPLLYRWFKDGQAIARGDSADLVFTNLAISDSGNYFVIITNQANSVTSAVVNLTITARPSPLMSVALDFNARSAPLDTFPGFQAFTLDGTGGSSAPNVRLFGGVEVTLSSSGGALIDDRKRTTPVNSDSFTEAALLQDFVFVNDTTTDRGLDVAVRFLETNVVYEVTVWSFDSSSGGSRISDWTANGTTMRDDYTFNGTVPPTSNEQYRFSSNITSDENGAVTVSARRDFATVGGAGVFLNALRVRVAPPVIQSITVAGGKVRIAFTTLNPTHQYKVSALTEVTSSAWTDVAGVTISSTGANEFVAEFDLPSGSRFYAIKRAP